LELGQRERMAEVCAVQTSDALLDLELRAVKASNGQPVNFEKQTGRIKALREVLTTEQRELVGLDQLTDRRIQSGLFKMTKDALMRLANKMHQGKPLPKVLSKERVCQVICNAEVHI